MLFQKNKRYFLLALFLLLTVTLIPANALRTEATEEPALANIEANMDNILSSYNIDAAMTEDQVLAAVETMDWETYQTARWELAELENDLAVDVLSEANVQTLVYNNPVFFCFQEALEAKASADNTVVQYATTNNTFIPGLSITDSVGTGTVSGSNYVITATGSTLYRQQNNITIKNTSGKTINLSFHCKVSGYDENNFPQTIAGTSVSKVDDDTISVTLKADETIEGNIIAPRFKKTVTMTLSAFSYEEAAAKVNLTLGYDSTLGSVTAAGVTVADGGSVEVDPAVGISLDAVPNSGVTFLGWVDANNHNKILAKEDPYATSLGVDASYRAIFAQNNGAPVFGVGGLSDGKVNVEYLFEGFAAAHTWATGDGPNYMVLLNNATLPAGDYTIDSEVTLLIPYDAAGTLCTTEPTIHDNAYTTPSVFRTLNMASGAKLTVNGTLSLSAQISSKYGYNGMPSGPLPFIKMATGSKITVENGAGLYAWGYITGSGSVEIKSGGTVYENFQISDYRGGDATSAIVGKDEEYGVFPFNQFYVQNIEVPMTLHAGATETGFAALYVTLAGTQKSPVPFIGSKDSMFVLSSGYVIKDYQEGTGRTKISIHGDVSVSSISISMKVSLVGSLTIDSSKYLLPIPQHFTVSVESGNVSIDQNLALFPGSELYIREGATGTLGSGKKIVVYDLDQWFYNNGANGYSGTTNLPYVKTRYVPGGDGVEGRSKDALVQVDGTINAVDGAIYVTSGGANIYSTGTGVINLTPGTETITYQVITNDTDIGSWPEIDMQPAILKDADGTDVATRAVAGTYTYYVSTGRWCTPAHRYESTVIAPTCTEEGYTAHTCIACGTSYNDTEVAATGHSYNSVVTAPTCTEKGCTTHTCTVCNHSYTDAETAALGHSYNSVVTDPTCTEQGYTTHTCSVCGSSKVDTYVEALGHTEEIDAAIAPTCGESGLSKGSHCSICNEVLVAQQPVSALGHSYNATVTPPTCTNGGSTTYTCTTCGDTYSEEAAATGHSYTGSVTKQPTCTETGVMTYTCTVCGDSYTEEIAVLSHPVNHATNVELGNSLNMYFAFWGNNITNTTGHYVEVSHTDWKTKETKTLRFEPDLWQTTNIKVGNTTVQENAYVVYYKNLSAKQMGDVITVRLYNGRNTIVHEWSDSIQNYAMRMLKKYEDDATKGTLCKLIVDMLNYGAACQTESGYNTNHLVNAGLSAEQQERWATGDITIEDKTSIKNDYHNSSNLVLTGNIQFVVAFNNSSAISKIEYTFANHWNDGDDGEAVTREETYYNEGPFSNKYLVVADARQMIAITVYDKEGKELGSWEDSVESYCARIISNTNATEAQIAVCKAFMKFADAAEAYLEGGNRV